MVSELTVPDDRIEVLEVDGRELPYVEFHRRQPAVKLVLDGEEYFFYKTFPLRGYAPALLKAVQQLEAEGKKVLVAYFPPGRNFPTSHHWDRLYLYATGIRPIGMGKAPGL